MASSLVGARKTPWLVYATSVAAIAGVAYGVSKLTNSDGTQSGTAPANAKGAAAAPADPNALPTDKLTCRRGAAGRIPVVLVSCGSFNPPTHEHLRMFDLAKYELEKMNYDVWGGYMSPVSDAYAKPELLPTRDRLEMCRLAANTSPHVMVDAWEGNQPTYTRTLPVLQSIQRRLQEHLSTTDTSAAGASSHSPSESSSSAKGHFIGAGPPPAAGQHKIPLEAQVGYASAVAAGLDPVHPPGTAHSSPGIHAYPPVAAAADSPAGGSTSKSPASEASSASAAGQDPPQPRVMLLCGADVLASMAKPGVWEHPNTLLSEHGVVAVKRSGTDVGKLMQQRNSLLQQHKQDIILIEEPVPNEMSSSRIRKELMAGRPVRYLVPHEVLQYIEERGLFGTPKWT